MNEIAKMNESVERFVRLLESGIESWVKAGELLVEMIEKDANVIYRISEKYPHIGKSVLYKFERIGRKEIYSGLLLSSCCGTSQLMKLPYSEQVRYAENPIPVLVENKEGGYDTLMIGVRNLTPDQCRQVFAGNEIRDEGAQRAWLEGEKSKVALKEIHLEGPTAYVSNHKLIVSKPRQFDKKELQIFLMAM